MRIYLVQHGEAASEDVDPKRPLTEKGRQDVERVAEFMKAACVSVERVFQSGKLRAEQTADIFARATSKGKPEKREGLKPNDEPDPAGEEFAKWNEDLMLVGHLPFMSRLVSVLTTGEAVVPIAAFQPGSVVCLERGEADGWAIDWMVRPELLK